MVDQESEEKAASDGGEAFEESPSPEATIDPDESSSSNSARPKTYILHRTNGNSRSYPIPEGETSDEDRKPPCFVCFVPFPVYFLSRFLEQNSFCESFGRIGCFGHNDYETRRNILLFALVANFLSFFLSLFACSSLSLNFNAIAVGGFSKGLAYITELDIPTSRIWIGLRGVAIRNFEATRILNADYTDGDLVLEFDAFCDYVDQGSENYMDPDDCNSCAEASGGLTTAVIMATLLVLPNILTDILRMYPNYDLNCQKFFGSVLNLASAASSLYAYRVYANQCFRSFYGEEYESAVSLSNNILVNYMQESDPSFSLEVDSTFGMSFLWRPGNGLVCIVLATFLKAFDIIAMLLIPTPDIAHKKSLQEEYEALYGEDNSPPLVNDEEEAGEKESVEKES